MKKPNAHRWTNDELAKLMEMWADGKELNEIAAKFSVSPYAVNKMVMRLRNQGVPLAKRTKGHKAERQNKGWTQGEVEYLLRRRGEGQTADAIAIELGRTYLAVNGMIQKLRKEGLEVPMLGAGQRRKWDIDTLKATQLPSQKVVEFAQTKIA